MRSCGQRGCGPEDSSSDYRTRSDAHNPSDCRTGADENARMAQAERYANRASIQRAWAAPKEYLRVCDPMLTRAGHPMPKETAEEWMAPCEARNQEALARTLIAAIWARLMLSVGPISRRIR